MLATAEGTWAPGPLHPLLAEGAVDVWRADLAAVAEDLAELLGGEEHARAERIVNERDRVLWRRSRGLLRVLLGRYLQRDPASLSFAIGEHGKPALARNTGESTVSQQTHTDHARLCFNMSHSAQIALYAFTATGEVGVDVEVARRPINEAAIAERMLGASEARRLEALDPAIRQREFLRTWARHEAELKCLGVGLGGAGDQADRRDLWVAQLALGPDVEGAVAAQSPVHQLRRWSWWT